MDLRYDGHSAHALAVQCGAVRVSLHAALLSTMDVAHAMAEQGAPAGTVVLTDRQSAGRGRGGRSWASAPGDSITLTLIERPDDEASVGVLSLRLGLAAAPVLEARASGAVLLKWPNDLFLPAGKLGGILVEARWREGQPEWVAIGVGINVRPSPLAGTAALAVGTFRVEILAGLIPAFRQAAAMRGPLTDAELSAFALRDWAGGRQVEEPARGVARGLSPAGALLVETATGLVACSTGSLVLAEN